MSLSRPLSVPISSKPSIPSMRMSTIARWGLKSRASRSASRGEVKPLTSCGPERILSTLLTIAGSSSTTIIREGVIDLRSRPPR